MADVLELPAGALPGAAGLAGVFAGACGDPGLLIHADHHRVRRAGAVERAHVSGTGEELRVGWSGQPAAHQVRLEIDAGQDPSDLGGGDRQARTAQVIGWGGRGGDDLQLVLGGQPGPPQRPGPVDERSQPLGGEPLAPGADGVHMPPGRAGRGGVRHSLGQCQDHRSPLHLRERRGARVSQAFKHLTLGLGQFDRERTGQPHRPTPRSAY